MLSRENVGYASTCNSVGQTAGYFLGNVLFLALESADFCNKYLRDEPQDRGVVTLSGKDRGSSVRTKTNLWNSQMTLTLPVVPSRLFVFLGNCLFDFHDTRGPF